MDAGAVTGGKQGASRGLDILGHAARQTADHRPLDLTGDGLHRLEIAVADDGEPRLDDVDLQARELAGDLQLLTKIHGGAGALLPVTEGRVKNQDSVIVHKSGSGTTGSRAVPG